MAHRDFHPRQSKKTTTDSKLKEYLEDYSPCIQYIMPEKDYDGEDMYDYVENYRNYEMHDGDYFEWFETVDDIVEYMKKPVGKNYVMTITFNRAYHTIPTMFNIEKHIGIIKYYVEECLDVKINKWFGVLEYHKKAIGALKKKPPHYHFLLDLDKDIEPCDLQKTLAAFWRHFGKCDFLPERDCWATYMCKNDSRMNDFGEFIANIKQYKKPHLFIID